MRNFNPNLMSVLSPINQKKARRRNIVPARIGCFALFYMCVYGTILIILYMIPIEVGKAQELSILSNKIVIVMF